MNLNSETEAKVATVHKEPEHMEILMPSQIQKELHFAEQMADRDNSFTLKYTFLPRKTTH
jgi:hypothetical protein